MLRRGLGVLLAGLVTLAGVTYLLGELVEGAVLYTRDVGGAWVGTKLWIVDHAGAPWVRVARPGRAWYVRLQADPLVELERAGVRTRHRAVPHPDTETRAAIDAAFREKNGAIDWWYGLVLREDAVPVELAPAPGDAAQGHS